MNKIIWSAWLQGRDKAPVPVEGCLASWEEMNPGWMLRCLDLGSVERYMPLRPHLDLARQTVTAASLSDVLRLLLLREYGGIWVDATLLCVRPLDAWLPQLMPDGFFAFASPGEDRPLASWFIAAEEDNMLLSRWCQRALDYWAERTGTDDYFWLHHLFAQMCETDAAAAQAWMRVPKVSARGALQLLPDRILQPYPDVAASVDWSVPVIKLTHRLPTSSALRGTLIEHLGARTKPDRPASASASASASPAVCAASASAAPRTFASLKVSTENLGDHIQIIAGLQLLDRFTIRPSCFIDRDDEIGSAPGLADVEAPVGILLNGWFKFNGAEWPPHWKFAPLFYGFHIRLFQCPELVSERSLVFLRQHGPIGCRDVCTEQLLRAHGVEAFTSNCLSLTLPRRMPSPDQQTEIFVVSKDEGIKEFLPKDLNYRFISHYTGVRDFAANMRRADALLDEYSTRARLIVTTLLHCALPAIAMGIPVVVFYPINHDFGRASDRERFSSLEKLIRIYRLDEMDEVDWSPRPLSVGALKLSILEGLYTAAADRWRLAPAAPLGPIAPPDALPDPIESTHSENKPKQPEMKREIDAVQAAATDRARQQARGGRRRCWSWGWNVLPKPWRPTR